MRDRGAQFLSIPAQLCSGSPCRNASRCRLGDLAPLKGAMKTPAGLQPLIDDGVIDEVLRSLKSGKEATVYVAVPAPRCAARRSIATWVSAAFRSALNTRKGARCVAAARLAP